MFRLVLGESEMMIRANLSVAVVLLVLRLMVPSTTHTPAGTVMLQTVVSVLAAMVDASSVVVGTSVPISSMVSVRP